MTNFAGSGIVGLVGGIVYTVLLLVVATGDVRARRIPNRLVIAIGTGGLLYSVVAEPSLSALGQSLLAALVGFGIWIPFYALRMLGAGDVKLFAAAGAWLAPLQVVEAALVVALVGGVLSVVGMVRAHGAGGAVLRLALGVRHPRVLADATAHDGAGRRTLPYGVAMAAGLIAVAWYPIFLLA